jgi:tRNA nucleotidyltransferase (CCA-adding enzyme)
VTGIDRVVQQGVRLVVPSDQERRGLAALVTTIMSRTRAAAKLHKEVHDVILGGSYAKGTWLPNDVDIDIFVRLSPDLDEKAFERIGLAIGARATSGYPRGKKYAQHPYTEATVEGVKVNIVPCYHVKPRDWRSAADRSPFHVGLVERLPETQKLQVRLLKRFMKSVGVYGAEIESEGFSGYAAEVLVIGHGDFKGVIRFFADFKPHSQEQMLHLPDPIDESRDLAKAISSEKLAIMILASRWFLRNPLLAYFEPKTKLKGKERPSLEKNVIGVTFSHPKLSEDTLWGELKRTLRHLESYVEARGFKIARSAATSNGNDRSAFLFIPEFETLPLLEQRAGPPVDKRPETEKFVARNRRKARLLWVGDDGRLCLIRQREFTSLSSLLEDTIPRIRKTGASREMATGIAKSGRVLGGDALLKEGSSREWLREGLKQIVSDTIGTGEP